MCGGIYDNVVFFDFEVFLVGVCFRGGLLRVGDSIESVCCTRSPKSPRGSISGGEDGSIISNRHECTVSIGNFSDFV